MFKQPKKPKIEKKEKVREVTVKGFQKVVDQVANLEDWVRYFDDNMKQIQTSISNLEKTIKKEVSDIQQRIKADVSNLDKKLKTDVSNLDKKLKTDVSNLDNTLKTNISSVQERITKDVSSIQDWIKRDVANIQERIKTQEDVYSSKLKEFSEQYLIDKNNLTLEIQEIRGEHDTMKVSLTVSDKQLGERIKALVTNEIKNAAKGKEYELLMKYWIEELKDIVENFDKLKRMHPKEFSLQLNEIAETVEIFKQKIRTRILQC